METIISAVISAAAAIIVCLISSAAQNKKVLANMDKHNSLQAYKLEQLTKTVDKHNQVIERVYELEKADKVEKEQIKVINHRIEDLEEYHK